MLPVHNPEGWLDVKGYFFALACDGRGHRDGEREYAVKLAVSDFDGKYFVGGEARFTQWHGGSRNMIFRLPDQAPSAQDRVRFVVQVHEQGSSGRLCMVGGLQVRPQALLSIHLPAWRCSLV